MLIRRLLPRGGGSFTIPPATLYAMFNGQNGDAVYAIGAATSSDSGTTWTQDGSNPVFQKTGAGWESSHVKDPWLMWDGSQFVFYYSGYDGAHYRIGRATFPSWPPTSITRYAGNPILDLGTGWENDRVTFPTVLNEPADTGREWKMWYIGNNSEIGYAYSSDGLAWTKFSGNPVVIEGSVGAWDHFGVGIGGVVKSGGTYYLFISGRKGSSPPQWQGGVVTCTDPEGTYTKFAGNPTQLARFNDANTTVALSADVAAGATTVSVTTTAGFNVGEATMLVDGNSAVESEEHYIVSIDSGTQVTIDSPTVNNFAHVGGVLRSFAYNSTVPRSVLSLGGAYVMFGTPFQPLDGLTVAGSSLREGAFRWTAGSLTGTWVYDYAVNGLFFPLYPVNTGWDKFSAENPSVIVAP